MARRLFSHFPLPVSPLLMDERGCGALQNAVRRLSRVVVGVVGYVKNAWGE